LNRYQVLFGKYVDELGSADIATSRWWQRLLDAECARGATPEEAEEHVRSRWPAGRSGHPLVLAAYRKYYIACEVLNEEVRAAYLQKMQQADASQQDGWGVEDDDPAAATEAADDWGPEWEIDPPRFLVEMLEGRRDDLAELMSLMVFSPVGEENDRAI
jgi:hypothetical protein